MRRPKTFEVDDDVTYDLRLVAPEPISREDYINRLACLPDWVLDEAGLAWAAEGRVLAVTDGRDTLYPRFQFDPEMQPRPAMAQVLAALPSHMDPWARAIWFATSNARLSGARPMDSLNELLALLAAARDLEDLRLAA